MDDLRFDAQIKAHEGERLYVYPDSLGNATVGIGHLVLPGEKLKMGDKITPAMSRALYLRDKAIAIAAARKLAPKYDSWDDLKQEALVNMIFNMGETKVRSMTDTLALMNAGKWNEVADKLRGREFVKWQLQVGKRAADIANMFSKTSVTTRISGMAVLIFGTLAWYILRKGKL